MKLKSFEIRSYRSCTKTAFSLRDDLTGLIGINGSGKSNILNAIVLLEKAIGSRPRTIDEEPTSHNKCHIVAEIEHQNKTLRMRGTIAYETDEHNFDDVYAADFKFNFEDFIGYPKWVRVPIQLRRSSYVVAEAPRRPFFLKNYLSFMRKYSPSEEIEIMSKSRKLPSILDEVLLLFSGINYYSATKFSDPSRCPLSIELEEERLMRKSRGVHGHEQFILDLYKSFKAMDTEYKRYINTVGGEGLGLIDKIEFTEAEMPSSSYEVKVGGKIKRIERNRLLIVPKITVNGVELSPNQLSEGTFKTLALVFYLLNDNSKLLLIEEPEVCVHHGLLNSIISLIKTQSKIKQIVVSTHSDFVLDHLNPENVLLVKLLPNRGTIATPLNKSMSKNDYKALRTYLNEAGNLGEYCREGGF